jgi:hypothetical protein
MSRYNDLLAAVQASGLATNLSPVQVGRIDQLVETYPGLPQDYIEFLREVGFGSVGDGGYMIYEDLVSPDEIFDPASTQNIGHLLMFGDDFQGCNAGFDPEQNWTVLEIDSATMKIIPVAKSFEEYVRRKISELIG